MNRPAYYIIGITGHRDILSQCIPTIKDKTRLLFKTILSEFPKESLQVLSPLAEGADQIVAEVGLEYDIPLIAPIPFSRKEYEKDFNPPSIEQFTYLLNQARELIELPLLAGNTKENIKNYTPNRDLQYAYAGAFVSLNSNLLIAMWDGDTEEETGGTSQILRYTKTEFPDHLLVGLNQRKMPIIYTICIPRLSTEIPKEDYYRTQVILPKRTLSKYEKKLVELLNSEG